MVDFSIIGKRFGRLTVVDLHHIENHRTYWLCKCDCGNEKVVGRGGLTSGDIISCGCYHEEHKHEFGRKHGLTKTKLYSTWSGMRQRCTNKNADNYARYGGRGIAVCDEWKNDFKSFYDWTMSNGYSEGLTIDRIDNGKGYEPSNCRWVSRRVQQNNMRRNRRFEYNGISHTMAEWSRILGVHPETLNYRIKHGNLKDFETLPCSEWITDGE